MMMTVLRMLMVDDDDGYGDHNDGADGDGCCSLFGVCCLLSVVCCLLSSMRGTPQ